MQTLFSFSIWSSDDVIYLFSLIGSSLSAIGLTFIVTTFAIVPSLRRQLFFQIFQFLVFADFLLMACGFLPPSSEDFDIIECEILGAIEEFGRLSSALWLATITYCFITIIPKKTISLWIVAINCLIIPAIISIIPLFFHWYGQSGTICWIYENLDSQTELYVTIGLCFAWYAIVFLYNLIMIMRLMIQIKKRVEDSKAYELLFYPLTILICNIFPVIEKVCMIFKWKNPIILVGLSVTTVRFQGFINSLIYGLTPNIKKCLKEYWRQKYSDSHILIRNDGLFEHSNLYIKSDSDSTPKIPNDVD